MVGLCSQPFDFTRLWMASKSGASLPLPYLDITMSAIYLRTTFWVCVLYLFFQLTFWKADHGRKFDDDGKHGNNVWMPCKGELFDQSEAWSTVRKRPLKTLWIVMVISSWGRWWKKIDIYEDDYLWRLLLFRKGLIKMDRNRNAIIFQMQGVMDIGHGIILNLKLQVCLRTTPPFPTTPSLHHHVTLQHVWRCLQVWISINTDPDAL